MVNPSGSIALGPWGGPGGGAFGFWSGDRIEEITVYDGGDFIHSLLFQDAGGRVYGPFGNLRVDHVDDMGTPDKFTLDEDEHLTSIEGTYGTYKGNTVITSLAFFTQESSYGSFGTRCGTAFSTPMRSALVEGFFGRSSYFLDAIGIYAKPVNHSESIALGAWGGPGGDGFGFSSGDRITEVTVYQGRCINSLAFKDARGREFGPFGGRDPDDNGTPKTVTLVTDTEHLTSIQGTYGSCRDNIVVTSLSLITNRTTYGPFGTQVGTTFSVPMRDALVDGFFGKSGYFLDAVGVYAKPTAEAISMGPWGGPGGDPWAYTPKGGITQIIIYVASNINSIAFRDSTGERSPKYGGRHPTENGNMTTVDIRWPSEHLVSISGTYGKFSNLETIISLAFITNRATYGPFGGTTGTSFSVPMSSGELVGFRGRAGHYLDAIAFFAKPEGEALWMIPYYSLSSLPIFRRPC